MASYVKQFKNPHQKLTKRTIKFLSICTRPEIQKKILQASPDSVIKAICNAAFNLQHNPEIHLSAKQKALFRKYNAHITSLTNPQISVQNKRKLLQTGGNPLLFTVLRPILASALSLLGSAFINITAGK